MLVTIYILHFIGTKYICPPPVPSNHVSRQSLLDEITSKLLQATTDPDKYETTLTITGAGGFGKTTAAISLCYSPPIQEQFTDGFIFIDLGPQATDPSIKLRAIHNLLTNEQCDINVVEQKISQLIREYYRNLLVIIDDVWYVEDAEPLVKAFSNCKTILTTRMNDIEQYIPSKQSVNVGQMTPGEAISLLTGGVIDSSQLSQEDVSLLNELVQDVHLWPLLLSLIRGQLSHCLKQYHLSYHKAIQNVQGKLQHKGLTAFDKNNIENINNSRKLAVKACIEITLELLTESLSDKLKILILWTGIGTSLQTATLNELWNVSKQEAEDTIDTLWAYGVVQFTHVAISPNSITQSCVEVHAVISQYIIECLDVIEVSPMLEVVSQNAQSVGEALAETLQQSYGGCDLSLLTAIDYLKYNQLEIRHILLPLYLKTINANTISDPYYIILTLQQIKDALMAEPYTVSLLSVLDEEINSLITTCYQLIKDAHKLCRKLNQSVEKSLCKENYKKLIQAVEEFIKAYPLCNVAKKAVTMVKGIIPYCEDELLHYMILKCEDLQMMTSDYHDITTKLLPFIKFDIKLHEEISSSLLNGTPEIELTYSHIWSSKLNNERIKLVMINRLNKLQQVAPNYVHQQQQHYTH